MATFPSDAGLRRRGGAAQVVRALAAAADRPSRLWFAAAAFMVIGGGAIGGLAPLLLKRLVDDLSAGPDAAGAVRVLALAALYVAALGLQRVGEQAQAYAYGRGEQRLVRRLGARGFGHLLRLPLAVHLDIPSGALAQSLNDGAFGARLVLTHAVMTVAPALVQLVVAAVVLSAVVGPLSAGAAVAALLAYAGVFGWSVRAQGRAARQISNAQLAAGGLAADGLMNVEAVKAFTAEDQVTARYDRALGAREQEWRSFLARRLEGGLAVSVVFAATLGGFVLSAAAGVAAGRLSLGDFVLLSSYVLQLVRPLEMLGFAMRDLAQGMAYLESLLGLLARPPEPRGEEAPAGGAAAGPAEVAVRDLAFRFAAGVPGLEGVSFRAPAGAFVGVVGPSGSGKSTLLRLLLRLYEPDEGEIRIDGEPIARQTLAALRRQVALVSQDTILLNDTIGANIAFAADGATPAAIARAARAARLDELIARLPQGLDTPVGERGLRLSGGEKQRVSIARAALRGARLVLFDEATAALDPSTERAVWRAMAEVAAGATVIAVTHRLSTVVGADQILVLDKGRIVQRGRHAELLASEGLYRTLWRSQSMAAARTPVTGT